MGTYILKVPMSRKGSQYRLVAQDYFSKWPFAVPLSDQIAVNIAHALKDQVFTLVGPLRGFTLIKERTLRAMC